MPKNLRKNNTLVVNCLSLGLLLGVVNCASTPKKAVIKIPPIPMEIPKQSLIVKPKALPKTVPPARVAHPAPKQKPLPVRKLLPEVSDEGDEENLDKLVGEEEESVGDSTQEILHFYYKGYELIKAGKYEEAQRSLEHFLSENPSHVYADRAQYLIAEANFLAKEYHLCILASNALEARYPYSLKLPDAAALKFQSLTKMNQLDQARLAQRRLAKNYPHHPATQKSLQPIIPSPDLPVVEPPVLEGRSTERVPPPLLEETYE